MTNGTKKTFYVLAQDTMAGVYSEDRCHTLPFNAKSSKLSSSSNTITTFVSSFQRYDNNFLNSRVPIDCWTLGKAASGVLPQEMAIVGTSSPTDNENAHSKHPSTEMARLYILTNRLRSSADQKSIIIWIFTGAEK